MILETYATIETGAGLVGIGLLALTIGIALERYHVQLFKRQATALEETDADAHPHIVEKYYTYNNRRLYWVQRTMHPIQIGGMIVLCLGFTIIILASV